MAPKTYFDQLVLQKFLNDVILSLGIFDYVANAKGPVELIKLVKIAHSFLQSVSNQFHVII